MNFFELLNISPGVTAVIGSGGKTSLLRRLAAEAPGTVLLCTTTHIRPFAEYPLLTDAAAETVLQALTSERVLCVGTPCENGKLTAPRLPMETLAALADYMLVEADGSRQMPLKAHAAHEPVIPACAERVICVAGASGFDRPIRACVPPAGALLRPDRRGGDGHCCASVGGPGHFDGGPLRYGIFKSGGQCGASWAGHAIFADSGGRRPFYGSGESARRLGKAVLVRIAGTAPRFCKFPAFSQKHFTESHFHVII